MVTKFNVGDELYIKCKITQLNCDQRNKPCDYRIRCIINGEPINGFWVKEEDLYFFNEEEE